LGDEHKTVLLSILATLFAAVVILGVTVAVAGGWSLKLFESYVLPLLVTAFSLSIFAGVLFARSKGMIPGFPADAPKDSNKPAAAAEPSPKNKENQ
jgi:hypothetical protein